MSQLQVTGEAKIRDIQGPVIANSGVITALDGAASQYVRGDGTLADFPTSTGGGSSVSYYLNSSVSQGTIGGVAYRELSKEPIIGAGTDITISANGYVASYITDANDPDVLSVPGGNFNCEFYFSVNNNTGNPTTYAELYKYDGTTFTLLGSSVAVPESLNQGTTIAPYYFAIPVATAALALTDRLAIRIYVSVDGRTVTLHTENSHLCQVVTTFSKGMVSLNNLTDQSQFITTGTSGTNFAIVSSGDTHTFNLPVASATNTGKLSNTDWSTFNNKQAALSFTAPLVNTSNTISIPAATSLVDGYLDNLDWVNFNTAYNNMIVSAAVTGTTTKTLTLTQQDAGTITASWTDDNTDAVTSVFGRTGAVVAQSGDYTTTQVTEGTNLYYTDARARGAISLTTTGTSGNATYNSTTGVFNIPNYTPDLSGYVTIGTTQTITGTKTFDGASRQESGILLKNNVISGLVGYTSLGGATNGLAIQLSGSSNIQTLIFQSAAAYSYTLPATSGTIALTSNISYPVTSVFGRTGAIVAVSGDYNTDLVTEGSTNLYFTNARSRSSISLTTTGTSGAATYNSTTGVLNVPQYSTDLSGYVTIATTQTITGTKTFSEATRQESGLLLKNGVLAGATGYASLGGASNGLVVQLSGSANQQTLIFQSGAAYSYTLPATSGTLALTSQLTSGTVTSVGLSSATSGVTIGSSPITTSGTITLAIATASGSQNGLLSSSDWTTFNNKQNALTNPVTGTGTTNYLPKFTGTSTIGNSAVSDDGTSVAVGVAITANTGNLQVGGTANTSLFSQQGTDTIRMGVRASGRTGISLDSSNATFTSRMWYLDNVGANGSLTIGRSGLDVLTFSNSGNLGLGVTPSAWGSGYIALQIPSGTYGGGSFLSDNGSPAISANAYNNAGWKYVNTDFATIYQSRSGQHQWFNAPSGTAGNAISFTQAMTLASTGNLLVGTTTDTGHKLRVFGDGASFGNGGDFYQTINSGASGSYYLIVNGAIRQTIASTGAATFSSSVTAGGVSYISGNSNAGPIPYLQFTDNYGSAGRNWALINGYDNYGTLSFKVSTAIGGNPYSGTSVLSMTQGGNVGIGITNPGAKLQVKTSTSAGATDAFYIENTSLALFGVRDDGLTYMRGNVLIGTTTDSGYKLYVSGTVASTGGFFDLSDKRLKTLITDNYQSKGIESVTAKLYLKNGKQELGYYAQDLQEILPSAVNEGDDGFLSLSYTQVHTAKIAQLEAEIAELKELIKTLL